MSTACKMALPVAKLATWSGANACVSSFSALDSRQAHPAPKPSVLVIDDSGAVCELLSLYLGDQGLEVASARSAAEARAVLERGQFDLVILDWTRKGTERPDLLHLCKARHPDIPVVIIADADLDEPHRKGALAGGADAVVPRKGFLDTLSTVICHNLDRRHLRSLNAA